MPIVTELYSYKMLHPRMLHNSKIMKCARCAQTRCAQISTNHSQLIRADVIVDNRLHSINIIVIAYIAIRVSATDSVCRRCLRSCVLWSRVYDICLRSYCKFIEKE